MTNREQDKTAPKAGAAPGSEDRDASRDAAGEVQGEGNYEASRRHQRAAHDFAAGHDTEKLAREAAPRSAEEKAELERAEREGRAHAAGDEEDLDISDDEPPAIQRGNE
jgi:hypothetical protein